MHVFYTPLIQPTMPAFLLDEAESKHAIRVLRLQVGEEVSLVDGRGGRFIAQIEDAHPKRVVLTITKFIANDGQRDYRFHLAIAPTKNMDRLEWLLEKATEIGLDEVTPIICDHSERKEVNIERLEKVMIAAMKQSLKAFLPKINPAVRLTAFLEEIRRQEKPLHYFIAHCADGEKAFLARKLAPGHDACVLIGPEGDFSPAEIQSAQEAGCQPITLGASRLRTETAGLAACLEVSLIQRVP